MTMGDTDQQRQVPFDAARCPTCGNEADNARLEPVEGADRDVLPPACEQGVCGACGRSALPAAFTRAFREHRMSDQQQEQAREARSEWTTRSAEDRW